MNTRRARNDEPIVVAGGGIGGLAAARALAIQGFRVLVLEQAREFGEIGAGIQLAPNAWHAIDALGVGEQVKEQAVFIERLLTKAADPTAIRSSYAPTPGLPVSTWSRGVSP